MLKHKSGLKTVECPCRRYENIKGQRELEKRAEEEQQGLIDLLRASDLLEASRAEAEKREQRRDTLRQQMLEANRLQIKIKAHLRNIQLKRLLPLLQSLFCRDQLLF